MVNHTITIFALFGCILTVHDSESLQDVAVHKPAYMSSQWGPREAGNAVDGVLSWTHNDCSNTGNTDARPWWKTNLQNIYIIKHIVVRNAG